MRPMIALAVALTTPFGAGAGVAYKWVAEDGVTHYGEAPPAGRAAEALTLTPAPASGAAPDYRALLEQAERLEQARLRRERERAAAERERQQAALLQAQRAEALARAEAWQRREIDAPASVLHRPFFPERVDKRHRFDKHHRDDKRHRVDRGRPLVHRPKPPLVVPSGRHDAERRSTHDAPLHGQR